MLKHVRYVFDFKTFLGSFIIWKQAQQCISHIFAFSVRETSKTLSVHFYINIALMPKVQLKSVVPCFDRQSIVTIGSVL